MLPKTQKEQILKAWEERQSFARIAMSLGLSLEQVRSVIAEHARESSSLCRVQGRQTADGEENLGRPGLLPQAMGSQSPAGYRSPGYRNLRRW